MKSAIVPFFNYGSGWNILFDYFKIHAEKWIQYVDKLYVIDSGCGIVWDHSKVQVISKPAQSHWQNLNEVIRETTEDKILLLDSDTIIYKPEVLKEGLDFLDVFDVASIMDSSGSEDLFGVGKRRLAPYLCFINRSVLPESFDFTPVGGEAWQDSMGAISKQLVDKNILELPDDRSTISLEDDGTITSTQWLDDKSIPEDPDFGYYHIRNFGGGLKLFNEGIDTLIPGREAKRLLAWVYLLSEAVGRPILQDMNDYYIKFREYHNYVLPAEEDPLTLY